MDDYSLWGGSAGTDAQIEVFPELSHGFGLGENTVAKGWLDHAVDFWKRNMGTSK
jgi:hypothetical protein